MLKYNSSVRFCLHAAISFFFEVFQVFSIGQKIAYGRAGVCIVEDITEKEIIKSKKTLYYVLRPYFQQNNVIYAPVDSDKVSIRPILTADEANELISKIPDIKKKCLADIEGKSVILSTTCDALIELTAKIYSKRKIANENKKKLGFLDEKNMHQAEELLFGEFAVALGINPNEVENYITQKLKESE